MACFLREVYLHSGTELIPLFPYLRAGLLKKGGGDGGIAPGNRLLAATMALQGFLTIRSTQAWAYRSPDEVSLDQTVWPFWLANLISKLNFYKLIPYPMDTQDPPTDPAISLLGV